MGPPAAECLVFTFKEGLLSPIAHDLKLAVGRFSIAIDAAALSVTARFDASSLRVVSALHGGAEAPGALSPRDRATIEEHLRDEVLEARRHPEIAFRSTAVTAVPGGFHITGLLALHGRERPLAVVAHRRGDHLVAEIALHQPDFGIQPYRAMLGTLRIRPDVRVRLTLPAPG
ncbi:MAG: YceI family protein [Myxococcales bacterium]|nr:YceI family protein [Myxococcales bacterium]